MEDPQLYISSAKIRQNHPHDFQKTHVFLGLAREICVHGLQGDLPDVDRIAFNDAKVIALRHLLEPPVGGALAARLQPAGRGAVSQARPLWPRSVRRVCRTARREPRAGTRRDGVVVSRVRARASYARTARVSRRGREREGGEARTVEGCEAGAAVWEWRRVRR